MRWWGRLAGLVLALWGVGARAQRVVVLELEDDRGGKVRAQVEEALQAAGKVEVVPLKRFREAAEKQRLRGARAQSAAAVAAVAPVLKLDAAVTGSLGVTFLVRILDPEGQELWTKAIPLSKGGISPENARKLAAAIAVAASPQTPEAPPETPPTPPPAPPEPGPEGVTPAPAEAVTPMALEPTLVGPGSSVFTFHLGGAASWRFYCSRPGVTSCAAYAQLREQPPGETVTYYGSLPYLGVNVGMDLFPLAQLDTPLRGLGLSSTYSRSFPNVSFKVSTPVSETPVRSVQGVDHLVQAMAVYRLYFPFGFPSGRQRLAGYAGLRAGALFRIYQLDPNAEAPIPSAERLHPAVGLELALPVFRAVRFELAAMYFPAARPGPQQRDAYGTPASSIAAGAEVALAGELWGPLGYWIKGSAQGYLDSFLGAGTRWPTGGAAEELFVVTTFGVTVRL